MSARFVEIAAVGVVVLALLAGPVAADNGSTNGSATAGPHIESVYPNPLAEDDAGEYVLLDFPHPTNLSTWTLTDGETNVSLSNGTVSGRVAVTAEPNATRRTTNASLLVRDESVSLANAGDEVALVHDGRVVDDTSYENAPDGYSSLL